MRKRLFFALLLSIVLLFTAPALADGGETYAVWVNGVQFTSQNALAGIPCGTGKATFDAAAHTLTLDGAAITNADFLDGAYHGIYTTLPALTLVVRGENRITLCKSGFDSLGIFSSGTLTISGPGTLDIAVSPDIYDTYGVLAQGDLTLKDVALSCDAGTFGIAAAGRITVDGATAVGKAAHAFFCGATGPAPSAELFPPQITVSGSVDGVGAAAWDHVSDLSGYKYVSVACPRVSGEPSDSSLRCSVRGFFGSALLAAAQYSGGRLVGLRVIPVTGPGCVDSGLTVSPGCTCKLFLMDFDGNPLSPCWTQ